MQETSIGSEVRKKTYGHLDAQERASLMMGREQGLSLRKIARFLRRETSTLSRELARNVCSQAPTRYDARCAAKRACRLQHTARTQRKLCQSSALFSYVSEQLNKRWSPEQIARRLKHMHADDADKRVCAETIYTALYALPRGGLKKELIGCLRQAHKTRRRRSQGKDRRDKRGVLENMLSIHVRPPEVQERIIPGHWEGDLIKGAFNRTSVGTLVERKTRLVLLAKMNSARAEDALEGFAKALARVPESVRKSMTYDQGREMALHQRLAEQVGIKIYFADPHSPWQRGSNENTNGLLRQYMPKGSDLSVYTQEELDAIAWSMNTRPRKTLNWQTPIEAFLQQLLDHEQRALYAAGVALVT